MTDNDGQTPLDVCEMYKKEDWSECLELLREQDVRQMHDSLQHTK